MKQSPVITDPASVGPRLAAKSARTDRDQQKTLRAHATLRMTWLEPRNTQRGFAALSRTHLGLNGEAIWATQECALPSSPSGSKSAHLLPYFSASFFLSTSSCIGTFLFHGQKSRRQKKRGRKMKTRDSHADGSCWNAFALCPLMQRVWIGHVAISVLLAFISVLSLLSVS